MKNYRKFIFIKISIFSFFLTNVFYLFFIYNLYKQDQKIRNFSFDERAKASRILLKDDYEDIRDYIGIIKNTKKFENFMLSEDSDFSTFSEIQRFLYNNQKTLPYEIFINKEKTDFFFNYNSRKTSYLLINELGLQNEINSIKSLSDKKSLVYDKEQKLIYFYKEIYPQNKKSITWLIIIDKKRFFTDILSYDMFGCILNNHKDILISGNPKYMTKKTESFSNFLGDSFTFFMEKNRKKIDYLELLYFIVFPLIVINFLVYKFSIFLTNRLYNPIKILKKSFKLNVDTTFDQLEKTYLELEKQNSFLMKKSKEFEKFYIEKQIKDYILGISENKPEILGEKNYDLMIVEILENEKFENKYSKEFLMAIKLRLEVVFYGLFDAWSFDVDFTKVCYIFEKSSSITKEIMENSLSAIEEDFSIDIKGFWRPNVFSTELTNGYKKLYRLLDYKDSMSNTLVICEEDIKINLSNVFYYPFETERLVIKNILNGNKKMVISILEDVFEENIIVRKIDLENLKKLKQQLINTAQRVIDQRKIEYDFSIMANANSIEDFKREFKNFIEDIFNEVNSYKDKNQIKEKIEEYLELHYTEDISLEITAEHIGFSSVYFSKLCKSLFEKNFKTLLDEKRVEKAKEILKKNPNIKIKELAILVGFNSDNSFIRIFKKYEGSSPGNYNKN